MRLLPLLLCSFFLLSTSARADAVSQSIQDAVAAFERAYPRLSTTVFDVDVTAYRNALTLRRFSSAQWDGEMTMEVVVRDGVEGSCSRYAAFVRLPPEHGTIALVLCPQFVQTGTRDLRRLTILHELVHVVAGPDECRAMAFAAQVEFLATGRYTPVERYWQANGCDGSGFALP